MLKLSVSHTRRQDDERRIRFANEHAEPGRNATNDARQLVRVGCWLAKGEDQRPRLTNLPMKPVTHIGVRAKVLDPLRSLAAQRTDEDVIPDRSGDGRDPMRCSTPSSHHLQNDQTRGEHAGRTGTGTHDRLYEGIERAVEVGFNLRGRHASF